MVFHGNGSISLEKNVWCKPKECTAAFLMVCDKRPFSTADFVQKTSLSTV